MLKFKSKNRIINIIIILLFTLTTFSISYNIGKEQIKIWDESSAARNAVEMLSNNKYFIAHNGGVPDHQDVKPPLQLWLKVISFKVFGINEFAVRFPSILSAIGIMLLLLFLAKKINNKYVGIAILYLMALTPGFMGYHVARHGDTDALLIFLVTGYYVSFFLLLEEYPKHKNKWFSLFGLFIVLATFTKSIAGLAPMAGFPIYFFLYKKNLAILKDYRLYLTIALTIISILSYYIIRELVDPGFLKSVYRMHFLIIKEYPGKVKHPEFLFYFTYLRSHGFYPFAYWTPLYVVPLIWSKNKQLKRLLVFSLVAALFFGIGQSSLVMKNEWYIAPIYIFLWVSLAISIVETIRIIDNRLRNKKVKLSLFSVLIFGFIYFYANRYEKIIVGNKKHNIPEIYAPEESGHTLREVKALHPEIKEITIATPHNLRQVMFYTKKFEYEDSSKFEFTRKVNKNHLHKFLLISDNNQKQLMESIFHYSVIEKAPYGALYYTDSLKVYNN